MRAPSLKISLPGARIVTPDAAQRRALDSLIDSAFGPGRYAKTAERIREQARPLTDLDRIALAAAGDGEAVLGGVRMWSVRAGPAAAAFLGPIAVDAEARKAGLGAALVEAATVAAFEAGFGAVVLVGDPPYFGPLGYSTYEGDLGGPVDPRRLLVRAAPGRDRPSGPLRPAFD